MITKEKISAGVETAKAEAAIYSAIAENIKSGYIPLLRKLEGRHISRRLQPAIMEAMKIESRAGRGGGVYYSGAQWCAGDIFGYSYGVKHSYISAFRVNVGESGGYVQIPLIPQADDWERLDAAASTREAEKVVKSCEERAARALKSAELMPGAAEEFNRIAEAARALQNRLDTAFEGPFHGSIDVFCPMDREAYSIISKF